VVRWMSKWFLVGEWRFLVSEEWLRDRTGAWGDRQRSRRPRAGGGTYLEVGPTAHIPSTEVLIEEKGGSKHPLKVGRTGSGGGPLHRMDTWSRGRGVGRSMRWLGRW